MGIVKFIFKWVFGSKIKIVIVILALLGAGFFGYKNFTSKNQQPQYQTAQAEKGSLINTVSASGQITTANNVNITIQVSGAVKEVLVKNGDVVVQGQTIATLTLDQVSQQKQASAYASFLSAKNSLDSANAKINTLQNTLFVANQKFINDAVVRTLPSNDPTYIEENAAWLAAEADYKNQQTVISSAQSSLAAASLNLSQLSSTITAPVSGTVRGLTITPGSSVGGTSQVLGSINQAGQLQAQVNISEVDSVKISEGQKVTMILDAFPNLTFTGKVISINTNGVVSSGVTTYPAVIAFDTGNDHIYPNMSVSAKIITNVKNDVMLVPSGAVQTVQGSLTVKVMRNGKVVSIPVEVGDSNDTQTEITSGISEGESVVTSVTSIKTRAGSTIGTSPFGVFGGRGFGGGGGIRRGD